MRRAARCWSPGSPAWSPARCRWPPASTCRSARRPTPRRPTSSASASSSPPTPSSSARNWRRSTSKRGLEPALARQVADQLMAHDALGAHARDELGLTEMHTARPIQAALASAVTFAVGATLPLLSRGSSPPSSVVPIVAGQLAGVPGGPRRTGGTRRRRERGHRRRSCHAVGRAGHGRHGGRREGLRRRRLTRQALLNSTLRAELLEMRAADLRLREELVRDGSLFDGYNERMAELHRRHNARLALVLARARVARTCACR